MRTLLTGADGMLGRAVAAVLGEQGHAVTPTTQDELDITDAGACVRAAQRHGAVVNCAAWTAVDDAEQREGHAFDVNAVGAANLAAAATSHGARMLHLSTDYVFDGTARLPYAEDRLPAPVSAYGRTKAAGEWAVLAAGPDHVVVRTAWMYGDGPCFPRTIARLLADRPRIEVVDDQRGQPTWSRDVAEVLGHLLVLPEASGIYHSTASGETTWFGFAREVALATGHDPGAVAPVGSDRFPRPASRPAYSVLGHARLVTAGISPIADWRERWRVAAGEVVGAHA